MFEDAYKFNHRFENRDCLKDLDWVSVAAYKAYTKLKKHDEIRSVLGGM